MSRIGRKPIPVPQGVKVEIKGSTVAVQGSKGNLSWDLPEGITCEQKEAELMVTRAADTKKLRAFHGLARAMVNNMVVGVSTGYEKELHIVGVGYKAQMKGTTLVLQMGFSHPVEIEPPEGVTFATPAQTRITINGIDKQLVGEMAARIRRVYPPEPYKGKGIRYAGEEVRKKLGKAMGK